MLGGFMPALAIATHQAAICSGDGGIGGQPCVAANSDHAANPAAYARLVLGESADSTATEDGGRRPDIL